VLLRQDVLGRSLIDVETARLVTAQEVELVCEDGTWRVAGIDPSFSARLRRLLPRRSRTHAVDHSQFVPWARLEPFVGHVPSSRLRLARLSRLHPAQIADLVEAASHDEGEEILKAVGQDKELEADVFEELNDEHQIEFLRDRSDDEVAAVLTRMEPDDAADLLLELDQDRRLPVLERLPPARQAKIKRLLGYNPSTAGGLMNPDFLALPDSTTASQALDAARRANMPEQAQIVFVNDAEGRLAGGVALVNLLRAAPDALLSSLIEASPTAVPPEADIPEIALVMADYNLTALPVVDADERIIGVLTVDDVLEQVVPSDWRRRYGAARG
jgi:Mg/Co/Ni transporter MgtE